MEIVYSVLAIGVIAAVYATWNELRTIARQWDNIKFNLGILKGLRK